MESKCEIMLHKIYNTSIFLLIGLLFLSACDLGKDGDSIAGYEEVLPPDYSDDMLPAWSPDGNTIAFTHRPISTDTTSGTFGIYFVDADGGNRRLFLAGGHSPAWSPDGQQLAFVCGSEICIINKDSTGFKSLGVEGFFPAWSPDGKKIAYHTAQGGTIYILDLFGNSVPSSFLERADTPSWSPDGQRIAFARHETPFSPFSIYRANIDRSGITQLTKPHAEGNDHLYPAWSHSGQKIAFFSLGRGLAVVNADGSNERIITTNPGTRPSWSPDDRYIVFSGATDTPGRGRLFIIKPDGTGLRQLTY